MLSMTKYEIEISNSNAGMYLFFKKSMRGGIFCISNRCSKLKNKQESEHIVYLDANNLDDYAMTKFFPIGGFNCIDPKNFDSIKNRATIV